MKIGERVELATPGIWPRDDREGVIVALVEQHGRVTSVRVRLDKSGRVLRLDPTRVETI